MADFLQILLGAIAVGSLYALIALGYTMVYGILKFINFAHSDVFVLGAWVSLTLSMLLISWMGLRVDQIPPLWMAPLILIAAMVICGAVGFTIERLAYRPLRKAPRLNVLITAIGVSLLLQSVGQLPGQTVVSKDGKSLATVPFGPSPQRMPTLLTDSVLNSSTVATGTLAKGSQPGELRFDRSINVLTDRQYSIEVSIGTGPSARVERFNLSNMIAPGEHQAGEPVTVFQGSATPEELAGAPYVLVLEPSVPIRLLDVIVVSSALVLMFVLQYLVFKTKLGAAMRAVSYNTETAGLMGIPVDRVISFTFVTGAMLAAAAGFLYSLQYPGLNQPAHEQWVLLGLKAFVAAVVGGIGNVRGAVLGGFLIALVEFMGMYLFSKYIDPQLGTNLRDVYVFGVLIIVLLIKPSGILGSPIREKV